METLFTNKRFIKVCTIFITVLCVCALVVLFEIVSGNNHGGNNANQNTISFTGHGEVNASPDIASISFTVEKSDSTQSASSDSVNIKAKEILAFLKSAGIDEKDIKTDNYSSYPKYSNPTPCYYGQGSMMPPCAQIESKIIGYTVSESMTVKVRKVDDASKVIDGINKIGVTNMSGPNFTIDNEDTLKAQARQKAIDEAKGKATELAHELGVRLGHITSFSENGNFPMPMYAKATSLDSGAGSAPTPEISKGENTISSDVTITYEIK